MRRALHALDKLAFHYSLALMRGSWQCRVLPSLHCTNIHEGMNAAPLAHPPFVNKA
ncbi:Uncharacterised protein [Vibrio cholerae]|nr:Uncharacterised protein [Vibrio cholerae]